MTTCSTVETTPDRETSTLELPRHRGGFVWRGYSHAWTYNHRINRLGDYLTPLDCPSDTDQVCAGQLVHTGASGTGADTSTFTSHYTEVEVPHATFRSGDVSLQFEGREQRDLRVEHTVHLPAHSVGHHEQYTVLLNGYDLYVEGDRAKAKKIKQFRVWARDAERDDQGVVFEVGGVLNMNCDSLECKHQPNRVRYTMHVRFAVIGYSDQLHATFKPFETSYRWSKREEIELDDVPLNADTNRIRGLRDRYRRAMVGFREISFDLAKKGRYKDHWYVNWTHSIRSVDYEASSGTASFDLNLFFKEWNQRTKRKVTSLARRGEATLRAEVALIQFQRAEVARHRTSGQLRWPGKNRSPIDHAAIWKKRIPFQ